MAGGTEAPGIAEMRGTMAMGKVAMSPAGFGTHREFPNINWDIVPPPEKRGGRRVFHGGCWGYGISSKSKYPQEAWEFIKFLTSEKVQRDWAQTGDLFDMPTRKTVVADFINRFPDKRMTSYLYAVENPNYEFQIKSYSKILSILLEEIEPVRTGVVPGDLKQACKKAAKRINEVLSEN